MTNVFLRTGEDFQLFPTESVAIHVIQYHGVVEPHCIASTFTRWAATVELRPSVLVLRESKVSPRLRGPARHGERVGDGPGGREPSVCADAFVDGHQQAVEGLPGW